MRSAALCFVASLMLVACGSSGSGGTTNQLTGSGGGGAGGGGAGGQGGSGENIVRKPIAWHELPTGGAPTARSKHTAVWTGTHMIVWGGLDGSGPTNAGASYDPSTGVWTATSTTGAPNARHSHTAVWTGSKMIVWGGFGSAGIEQAGGAYDPATDSWAALSTTNQPPARSAHTAVWTGSKMIVWGGSIDSSIQAGGGIYDPKADSWATVATSGSPKKRQLHSAVWTGSSMLVFGGTDFVDWFDDGGALSLDPAPGGSWKDIQSAGAPAKRQSATGVWTGSSMLVWGGWTGGPYLDTGGLLNPSASGGGKWTATSLTDAPSERSEHVGVWGNHELIVWGGCNGDQCGNVLADGGRFTPDSSGGKWTSFTAQDGLSAAHGATGVYTGDSIIVWGGTGATGDAVATGARSFL